MTELVYNDRNMLAEQSIGDDQKSYIYDDAEKMTAIKKNRVE